MICTNTVHPLQIALFVQVEKMRKVCLLLGCCNRCKKSKFSDDFQDDTKMDTTTRSVGQTHVTVTPHFKLKTLSCVVGVESISTLISDFEQHSVSE